MAIAADSVGRSLGQLGGDAVKGRGGVVCGQGGRTATVVGRDLCVGADDDRLCRCQQWFSTGGCLFTFLSFFRGNTPASFLSNTKLSAPILRSRAAVSGVSAVPSTSLTLAFAQALTKRKTARTRSSSSCRRTLSVLTLNLSSSPLNLAGPVSACQPRLPGHSTCPKLTRHLQIQARLGRLRRRILASPSAPPHPPSNTGNSPSPTNPT